MGVFNVVVGVFTIIAAVPVFISAVNYILDKRIFSKKINMAKCKGRQKSIGKIIKRTKLIDNIYLKLEKSKRIPPKNSVFVIAKSYNMICNNMKTARIKKGLRFLLSDEILICYSNFNRLAENIENVADRFIEIVLGHNAKDKEEMIFVDVWQMPNYANKFCFEIPKKLLEENPIKESNNEFNSRDFKSFSNDFYLDYFIPHLLEYISRNNVDIEKIDYPILFSKFWEIRLS